MTDAEKPPPLRFTKQLAPDRWVTECKVCPKRVGKRIKPTQLAADMWWTEHIETGYHKHKAARDRTKTAEEILLDQIFGTKDTPGTPKNQRKGEVLRRPGHMSYRPDDPPA